MALLAKLKEAAIAAGYTWGDITDQLARELGLAISGDPADLIAGLQQTFPSIASADLLVADDVASIESVISRFGPNFIQLPKPKIKIQGLTTQTTFDEQTIAVSAVFVYLLSAPEQLFDPDYSAYIQLERRRRCKASRRRSRWVAPNADSAFVNGGGLVPNRESSWSLAGKSLTDSYGPVQLASYRKYVYPFIDGVQHKDKPVLGVVGEYGVGGNNGKQAARLVTPWTANRLSQRYRFRVVLTNPATGQKVFGEPSEEFTVIPLPYPLFVNLDTSIGYTPSNRLQILLR